MDLSVLQARAAEIAALYDEHNTAAGRGAWTTGDLALGFVAEFGRMTDGIERHLT
ncbi:hypothetical protein [Dactylosporangium sp. NPDC050588]|uniref:hypothetical protein n=1 Tax=Dactylosporangium sp. NPDC050588 TaxID=3157211 RepID=UPI0033E37349